VVFLPCGHFFTTSALDLHFDLDEGYEAGATGNQYTAVKKLTPFSFDSAVACPTCHSPLLTVSRYGCLSRRAHNIASLKKIYRKANEVYLSMSDHVISEEERLANSPADDILDIIKPGGMVLTSSRDQQYENLRKSLAGSGFKRYAGLFMLRTKLVNFLNEARENERPFKVLYEMISKRRNTAMDVSKIDTSICMPQFELQASTLLLRLDTVLLSDFVALVYKTESTFKKDLAANYKDCEDIISAAALSKNPLLQVEGHVLHAKYSLLQLQDPVCSDNDAVLLKKQADLHASLAFNVCEVYPISTMPAFDELEAIVKSLGGGQPFK